MIHGVTAPPVALSPLGFVVVRGGGANGGWNALVEMAQELAGSACVFVTADGAGPARVAKVGAVENLVALKLIDAVFSEPVTVNFSSTPDPPAALSNRSLASSG
jgi:lysophospholipid acyltransferase (LPLAT)-like uncharacterized protein